MSFSDLLKPRREVLTEDGVEGIIDLANLTARGKKRPLEARAEDFFELTYPTADVRRVVAQLNTRFSGNGDVPGLFLFEGLKGSGKSHLLLFVYHLFKNAAPAGEWLAKHSLSCSLPADAEVILIKFTDLPLESIWGFIFQKLTGKAPAKAAVQPGLAEVEVALGSRRLVLILDELEQGIRVISDPALQAQNIAFLQMLSEWGKRSDQVTMFASIYSDQVEPGSTLKRVQPVRIQFAQATDRERVVLHRLFSNYLSFDPKSAAPVIESYLSLWQRHAPGDLDRLRNAMQQGFPFSPGLLDVILERVPKRGGFQNVRGALGFLAHLVRLHHKTADLLTPAHADLADKEVRVRLSDLDTSGDLITRAHDNFNDLKNDVPLASEVASSVLLYTLASSGKAIGATRDELVLAVLGPGENINTLERALFAFQKYASNFWLRDGRYLFDTEENPDAKVELRSLGIQDAEARTKLHDIWRTEVFREPNTVIFTDAAATKTACEALEKDRLRYVLAPRRLKAEERHDLYHGLSVRNQVILLEPRDAKMDLNCHADLLKWAKRLIAAQGLIATTPDAERRVQYEHIGKEDKANITAGIRRAGLVYIHFEQFGATPTADIVEEESLGNATGKDDVQAALSQHIFPAQLVAEHLGGRLVAVKGRTVADVDREYRATLGFPVPTHVNSVSRAIRELCRGPQPRIGVRHPRGNFCGEEPQLSESELLAATIDDPFTPAIPPPAIPGGTPPFTPQPSPQPPIPPPPPPVPPGAHRETIAVPPQTSAGLLRQEIAARLAGCGADKVVKTQFTIHMDRTEGDLSSLPASFRGTLSGPGRLSVEITVNKEGDFSKGQIEQMTESLPNISGAEYQARLEAIVPAKPAAD
jgi:hypothetical protein